MQKARTHLGKHEGALRGLTHLQELPDMTAGEHAEKLKLLRDLPMQGEEEIMWAVQEEDRPDTRQPLPSWISAPLSMQLLKWSNDANTWDLKMAKRTDGLLAPAQQKKFEEWQEKTKEHRMLFSKKHKNLISHLSDQADLSRIRKDLFLVILKPDADASKLRLQATNGESKQLVALKGAACPEDEAPKFLYDSPMDPRLISDLVQNEGDQGLDPEEILNLEEADAMAVEDMHISGEHEENILEILAFSDDEIMIGEDAPKHKKIKSFMHRESYKRLAARGLAHLPTTLAGLSLGCHSTSQQWQRYFPGIHTGLCYNWGGRTGRTEIQALAMVLKALLQAFVHRHPREGMWKLGCSASSAF